VSSEFRKASREIERLAGDLDIQEKAQREMGMDISLKSLRAFEDISPFKLSSG